MKKIFVSILSVFILLFSMSVNAQTDTDIDRLQVLQKQFEKEWTESQLRVEEYASENNLPIRQELDNGRVIQLIDVIDGKPIYYTTDNLGAAKTTRADQLWEGGSSGLNITGEGYEQLGEWDAGGVRVTHQEFTDQGESRVTQMDSPPSTHYHATHVAGTMVAAGIKSNAQGMAYAGKLKAWDWIGDNIEMTEAAADGLELSNHSYGQISGWDYNGGWTWHGNENVSPDEAYSFGFYGGAARSWDLVSSAAPHYLIVTSAGNDRGEGPGYAGQNGNPEKDGGSNGYDCIGGAANAKNVLTVGAVNQVSEYSGPGSVVMSSFSCWGPEDDGRIKPDIVGKGVNLYSTMDGNNTAYSSMSGTSMSSPNVAGSLALLQKYYQDTHDGTPMRSATLKALVLHTADEAGAHPGPDYKFGWGLMNTLKAADLITEDEENELFFEEVLEGGDLYMKDIYVPEGAELRITLCWTDPAGTPVPLQLDPRDPMLVNDLDISIRDESFNVYYPYSLSYEDPTAPATTTTKNGVDNVEMIYLPSATEGTYSITITHDGWLEGNEQAYSLIITGTGEENLLPDCSAGINTPEDGTQDVLLNKWISWLPAEKATSYDVYFGTDGGGTETPSNIYNKESFENIGFDYYMEPGTTYYLQVIPTNESGSAEGCDQIWSFTTMEAIDEYPYSENVSDAIVPGLPQFWQAVNNDEALWQSTDQWGYMDEQSMLCAKPEGIVETKIDNWFISPPFDVQSGFEYVLTFQYANANAGSVESLKAYWGITPFVDDMAHLIYEDNTIDVDDWKAGEGIVHPDFDGLLYFGFHAQNESGFGVFLDEIIVENWGTENINVHPSIDDIRIYSSQGKIIIQSDNKWLGSEIRITNILGQEIYRNQFSGKLELDAGSVGRKGLFIVSLFDGKKVESKKIMVR